MSGEWRVESGEWSALSVIPQTRSGCRDLPSLLRSQSRCSAGRSRHSLASLARAG